MPPERTKTGFFLHPAAALHDTGWGHAEHQGRLRTLASTVGRDLVALHGHVEQFEGRDALDEEILRVHTPEHIARVRAAVAQADQQGAVVSMDPDTRVCGASWDAASGGAGSLLRATELVSEGALSTAFVAARPPGHHATPTQQMGFCLLNNVAIAARHLQATGHAERVLIVDFDVHHGNGTQDAFYEDPSVFFVSLHQYPYWPGSGASTETGTGAGEGTTLNVPLAAATPRAAYREAFSSALDKVASSFKPDFVLVSAGFDALAGDPLGELLLEPSDYHGMTSELVSRAQEWCGGRVVAVLEGGYDPQRTGQAAALTLRALAGITADGGPGAVDEL